MKKIFLFLLAFAALSVTLSAQTVLFSDDFEGYNTGDYVAEAADTSFWTTWSGEPGSSEDALVSDAQNHTTGGSKSAHTQGNTTDLVLNLGNKTSGRYMVEFYYYIPSGKGGYFNIQHTENMGEEWAFECYFGNNGNGYLTADGSDHNFTHANDAWIYIKFYADLDEDTASLYIDNNLILNWTFSHQSDGSDGLKQLGAVDFYAGAPSGQSPEWYLDDVVYTEVESGLNPPELSLSTTSITTDGTTQMITIKNEGEQPLIYDVYIRYPEPSTKTVQSSNNSLIELNTPKKTVVLGLQKEVQKLETPIKVELPKDVTLTHLQSDIASSLGFNSQVDVLAAALFKSSDMSQYIGMELSNLIIYVGQLPVDGSTYAKVWTGRKYTVPGPINEVASQAFTPSDENSQNSVNLDNPVFISGDDLWFGWAFTDPGANVYPLSMDDGPLVDDGNWIKYGPSWSEETNSEYGNYGLVGTLTGDTIFHWVDVNYSTAGQIAGGDSVSIPVQFNLSQLTEGETYNATLVVRTNDATDNEDLVEIPITLTYQADVKTSYIALIKSYPNPATDFFYITSAEEINKVEVYSLNGQLVKSEIPNTGICRVNVQDLQKGAYIVKVYTDSQTSVQKLIVK